MDTQKPLSKLADIDLLVLAQKGERQAYEELMTRYQQEAYHIAFDFTRDREEAKDLSQEAFLRAFVNLRGFNHRSTFHTWFYRILANLCLDYRRSRNRVSMQSLDESGEKSVARREIVDTSSSPDSAAMANEISSNLESTLNALPPKQQKVYLLKNQGLSIREISKVTKTAEGAVRVNLNRAMTALKESLAKFLSGGSE